MSNTEETFSILLTLKEHIESTLEDFMTSGFDLDDRNEDGDTLLIIAARLGNEKLVDVLIEDILGYDLQNNTGSTAAIEAAKGGHFKILSKLILNLIDINIRDISGKTLVDYLSENDRFKHLNPAHQYTNSELSEKLSNVIEGTFDINTLQILRMEDFIRSKIEGWDSGLFEMITTVRIAHPEMSNYQLYKSEIEGLVEKHRNEEYYQKFVKYYANNNSHIIELYTPGKYLMKINPAKIAKVINPCDGISNALCIISDNLNKNDILKTHISNILDLYHKAQIEMANPLHKITGTIGNETEKLGDTPDCPDDDSPF